MQSSAPRRQLDLGPHFSITVNGLSANYKSRAVVFVRNGNPNASESDLLFQKLKPQLESALMEVGFGIANREPGSDLNVFLSFQVVDKKREYSTIGTEHSYESARVSQTFSSSTTSGSGSSSAESSFSFLSRPWASQNPLVTTSEQKMSANTEGRSVTVEGPRDTFSTNSSVSRAHDTYVKEVQIAAFETKGKRQEVWRTVIAHSVSDVDWRRYFPKMVAGALPFIGRDTGGVRSLAVFEDSEEYVQAYEAIAGKKPQSQGVLNSRIFNGE